MEMKRQKEQLVHMFFNSKVQHLLKLFSLPPLNRLFNVSKDSQYNTPKFIYKKVCSAMNKINIRKMKLSLYAGLM
jgi:hypothetical protein